MRKIQGPLICTAVGIVASTGGLSVTNSWQAWALIVLAALNGVHFD